MTIISTTLIGQTLNEKLTALDQLFQNWNGPNPGCAIGIIHQGQLIYEKAWGLEDVENKIAISSQSGFHIASMSKQFIAAGIGLLSLEGKLKLEDPISKYLTELNTTYHSITIKQLIHHISGIKDYSNLMFLRGNKTDDFISLEKGIKLLNKLKSLNFDPGTAYVYSNSNYLLLAEIISRASKMDFRDYIHQKIFVPLGMRNTYFINYKADKEKRIALDYKKNRDGSYMEFKGNLMAAEDQIISTVRDLYLWDKNFKTPELGGQELKNILLEKGELNNGREIAYAFALFIRKYKGLNTISHSGDMGGYHSQYLRFPEEDLSIIILSNASDLNAFAMSYQMANILLKDKFQLNKNHSNDKALPTVKMSNKELKKFIGSYWNDRINRPRIVYLRDDTLRYNRPDNYESPLVPLGGNLFSLLNPNLEQHSTIKFVFENSKLTKLLYQSADDEPVSMKKYDYPNYNSKQLVQYAGKYYCKELEISYEIQRHKAKLMLWVNGEEISKLVAIKDDIFTNGYFGDFRYLRDDQDQIKGFYVDKRRAKNIYFEKLDED